MKSLKGVKKIGFIKDGKLTLEHQPKDRDRAAIVYNPYDIPSANLLTVSEDSPVRWREEVWLFKGQIYQVGGLYSDDQFRLLILDDFDKERKRFEELKRKHDAGNKEETRVRIRIPERVRIEVWRRDGGKCVICGGRENLEYDHIIPLSKGGSNTARNIELLCEKHNRSKGANIA